MSSELPFPLTVSSTKGIRYGPISRQMYSVSVWPKGHTKNNTWRVWWKLDAFKEIFIYQLYFYMYYIRNCSALKTKRIFIKDLVEVPYPIHNFSSKTKMFILKALRLLLSIIDSTNIEGFDFLTAPLLANIFD